MKNVLSILLLSFTAISSFAQLQSSVLDSRHQTVIANAVSQRCGVIASLIQLSNITTPIKIDQGITDFNYETELVARVRIDQGQYDEYKIKVFSHYSDAFDHSSRNWGSFSVQTIQSTDLTCN